MREPPRRDADRGLKLADFAREGASAGGGDAEPLLARRGVGVARRGIERADPAAVAQLVERSVERDRPELEPALGQLEHVAHDRQAVAILRRERQQDEEPMALHAAIILYSIIS